MPGCLPGDLSLLISEDFWVVHPFSQQSQCFCNVLKILPLLSKTRENPEILTNQEGTG